MSEHQAEWAGDPSRAALHQEKHRYLREQRAQAAKSHRHRVVLAADVRAKIHALHPAEPRILTLFNTRAAQVVSNVLSSMYFFWFCVVLDVVELPAVIEARSLVIWVGFASQTVIQLLALPALGAAGKLVQELQDHQSQDQGQTLDAIHTLVGEVHTLTQEHGVELGEHRKILERIAPAQP